MHSFPQFLSSTCLFYDEITSRDQKGDSDLWIVVHIARQGPIFQTFAFIFFSAIHFIHCEKFCIASHLGIYVSRHSSFM